MSFLHYVLGILFMYRECTLNTENWKTTGVIFKLIRLGNYLMWYKPIEGGCVRGSREKFFCSSRQLFVKSGRTITTYWYKHMKTWLIIAVIHNLSNCKIKAWKKFRPESDSNPWPLRYRCSALPTELSSHLGDGRVVYDCDDQSYLRFFLRSSNVWSFIYSLDRSLETIVAKKNVLPVSVLKSLHRCATIPWGFWKKK